MKTLLALAAAAIGLTTVGQNQAQAGHPHQSGCRVHSSCGHCQQPVYSYYRPVRYYNSTSVYAWVPSYHNQCRSTVTTRYYRGPSISIHSHNYGYSRFPSVRTTSPSLNISRSFYRASPSIRFRSFQSCR